MLYLELQHCNAWVAAHLFLLQPLARWPQHGSFCVQFFPMLWDGTPVYPLSAVLLFCPCDAEPTLVIVCSI